MYGIFKNFVLRNNLVFYLVAILGLIFVVFSVSDTAYDDVPISSSPISDTGSKVPIATSDTSSLTVSDIEKDKKIYIDIQGAVNFPGVYELKYGQRISDAIVIAGELSSKADKKWISQNINRAVVLRDGDKLYIPTLGEAASLTSSPISIQPTVLNNTPIGYLPSGSNIPVSASVSASALNNTKISLNHATSVELDSLPGIGAVRAQKIIQGRPYQKTEDLVERKVIYNSLYEKIKDQITL